MVPITRIRAARGHLPAPGCGQRRDVEDAGNCGPARTRCSRGRQAQEEIEQLKLAVIIVARSWPTSPARRTFAGQRGSNCPDASHAALGRVITDTSLDTIVVGCGDLVVGLHPSFRLTVPEVIKKDGAAGGYRTYDLSLTKGVLYH